MCRIRHQQSSLPACRITEGVGIPIHSLGHFVKQERGPRCRSPGKSRVLNLSYCKQALNVSTTGAGTHVGVPTCARGLSAENNRGPIWASAVFLLRPICGVAPQFMGIANLTRRNRTSVRLHDMLKSWISSVHHRNCGGRTSRTHAVLAWNPVVI